MKFLLIGQPNCGKSTLFNQVCGYRAETGNFTGTTVSYTESSVRLGGGVVDIVDLPGTYTLAGTNAAEQVVFNYLIDHDDYNCIINVVDASHLNLGLGLTLELLELHRPLILVLNMIDEADHFGIQIKIGELSKNLAVPVVPMIASKGRGIRDVFTTALKVAQAGQGSDRQHYTPEIESAIKELVPLISDLNLPHSDELIAIKLLESDPTITGLATKYQALPDRLSDLQKSAFCQDNMGPALAMNFQRNALAQTIAHRVIVQGTRNITLRDRLDDYLLHPVWGYVFLILVLYVFFQLVFTVGGLIEKPLMQVMEMLSVRLIETIHTNKLISDLVTGLIQGISGGLGIVMPYLIPFLIGLGFLEDLGYLPRIAFLMDAFMHHIGLHGAAVVPFILGFGCNVPSIMATRTLDNKREQFIAAALATLVPCSARLAVVFGLVAFYLGPLVALLIYLLVFFVIALTGKLMSRLMPENTPGLILEIPPYRVPSLRTILSKAWFRVKEFVVEAWPILIAGSLVLAFLNSLNLTKYVNYLTRPITWLLGLPDEAGIPMIFGVLRKELSLIMLGQAMGTMNFQSVLSPVQMITFSVFIIFYVPCLATLVTLHKELGRKAMWNIMAITFLIATVSALIARGISRIIY